MIEKPKQEYLVDDDGDEKIFDSLTNAKIHAGIVANEIGMPVTVKKIRRFTIDEYVRIFRVYGPDLDELMEGIKDRFSGDIDAEYEMPAALTIEYPEANKAWIGLLSSWVKLYMIPQPERYWWEEEDVIVPEEPENEEEQ
jgi:hypothetical protein